MKLQNSLSITLGASAFNPCWDGVVNDGVYTPMHPDMPLDGVHPHSSACNAYFHCNNGTQSADWYCPEGLLFNGQTCDFPHNVQCDTQCSYGKTYINLLGAFTIF